MSADDRIHRIKREINRGSAAAGCGPNGWRSLLDRLSLIAADIPDAVGMAEPEFCRLLPIVGPDQEVLLRHLHRAGVIWRRADGVERRIFARRPEHLGKHRGRPPRSRPVDVVEREVHRAFSDGLTALVDAIDQTDEATQQTASEAIRKAAERIIRRGVTWAAVRASLRVYRPDALAVLQRHETAFDPRSGECLIDAAPSVPRTAAGASLTDRVLRAVEVAGPGGATRSRLSRVTSSTSDDLTTALASLEADGLLIRRMTSRGGQGSRPALRYTLGA